MSSEERVGNGRGFKSLMSQYRGIIFAIRTAKRDPSYEDLRYTLADALIEAAKRGAGVRLPTEKADGMAAHLMDGMLPVASMPGDYQSVERELMKALDKGSRQRAVGLAQALAMMKYPSVWARAGNAKRAELIKGEMGE